MRDRQSVFQSAKTSHIDDIAHRVHHTSRCKEQQGLEESVCEQMKHTGRHGRCHELSAGGATAECHEHESQLTHG